MFATESVLRMLHIWGKSDFFVAFVIFSKSIFHCSSTSMKVFANMRVVCILCGFAVTSLQCGRAAATTRSVGWLWTGGLMFFRRRTFANCARVCIY